jgi:fructose-1,6-bisphosphatase I
MVGDVHRALPKGGIFAASAPNGKLRLMCERNPLGMVIAQAGSKVMSGTGEVIDMKPTDLNQHVPIALDSPTNVDAMLKALHDADA